jgi:hypothetical protein
LFRIVILLSLVFVFNSCRKVAPVEPTDYANTDIKSFISISRPVSGERYLPADTIKIIWAYAPSIKIVNIELYEKNASLQLIAFRIPNDGDFSWKIPAGITLSTNYKIKISSSNSPEVLDYSGVFSILFQ